MSTHAPRSMTPPSPGHGDAAKAAHIIKAAKELLLDAQIDDYVALVDENTLLKNEKQTLKGDIESQDRRISNLLNKMDGAEKRFGVMDSEIKKQRNEIEDLSHKLSEAQEELRASRKEMASKEAALAEEVATFKTRLDIERRALQKLKGFSVELLPVAKSHKEISAALNKIFASARSLAEASFGDMPPQIRSNPALWENIKNHPAVRKDIPIPLSDTPAAKQMRIAAFLAVLVHQIRQHIFQPTYLLQDRTGLNKFLDDLTDSDAESEAHLRSVIVRLADSMPEETNAVIASRITTVVINVLDYVRDLIPEKSRPGFETKLRNFCAEACEQWKFIQKLDGKINVDFDADEARPLYPPNPANPPPSDRDAGQQPNNAKSRNANGGGTTTNNNNNNHNNNKKSNLPTPPGTNPLADDPVVIWPAFYNQSTHALETLVQGYLLTAGQVAVAKAEEKAQQQQQQAQSTGQRRAQRQQTRSSRAMSMSMAGVGAGAGVAGLLLGEGPLGAQVGVAAQSSVVGSASGSGSFLSQASGGGRKNG
ncbi:hypothetical protein B0I37DRAFT_415814 [Chaetomium sp. MPI-CAGE-AT-0009]|nr:hypothetical protein B0I37DRAFT_415814 [Chaetomium sp. MPI-CAGE-AT-0009]